jgi:hypothetical protein
MKYNIVHEAVKNVPFITGQHAEYLYWAIAEKKINGKV